MLRPQGWGEARLQPPMVVSLASCPGRLARSHAGRAELIYFQQDSGSGFP